MFTQAVRLENAQVGSWGPSEPSGCHLCALGLS
jgi:hypothetical protein